MSAFDSLPVAPEFISVLQESAAETAVACLKTLAVPAQVIALVEGLYGLGYYFETCYQNPEYWQQDHSNRYDIELTVIETINAIAACGGTFAGPSGAAPARPAKFLAVRTRKRQVEPAQA